MKKPAIRLAQSLHLLRQVNDARQRKDPKLPELERLLKEVDVRNRRTRTERTGEG